MRKNVTLSIGRWTAALVLSLLLIAVTHPPAAVAQEAAAPAMEPGKPKALPGLGRDNALRPAAQITPPPSGLWGFILQSQQRINRALTSAVRELKETGSAASAGMLAFLSFAYGVLHAAGPGHGKAIISSYVLANEKTVRRGVLLSFLAALIQALSAIVIVTVIYGILKSTSIQMRAAEAWIETLSWALVTGIGAWLLLRQIEKFNTNRRITSTALAQDHHPQHVHHAGDCGCDHDAHTALTLTPVPKRHNHDHDHASGGCAECGHAHMPDPKQLEGELGWRKALAIAFSVGIRPCTGAILVLVFALSQGMLLAGIAATFAMALGTAITVSVLAALAVGSRELAQRVAGDEGGWGRRIEMAAGFGGAAAIFLMGAVFLIASLKGPAPL